jgi:LacI family transcriptional regulator
MPGQLSARRAAGRASDHALTAYGDFRTDGGYAAAKQLLRLQRPPDGLLISNDLMTIGGLQAIAEAGLSIPGDIAVVGFDNASWATAFRPPLTVVTQPTYEIGQVAADLLLRRVSGEKFPPRHVVLRAKLVERESSRRSPQERIAPC